MNIQFDREQTLPTLSLVSTVVEKKQTLPMLANLYFDLTDNHLRVIGTDLEMEISETISGVEGDNGSFTVSTQKIFDIARMLPENASIAIELSKNKLVLVSGRTRYTLQTLPPKDFPRIETDEWEERFTINQSVLKKLLEKTAFAMATQDVRYYLNGVLFELSNKRLRAIATDGHRLAQSDIEIKLDMGKEREIIVPRKAITEIQRLVEVGAEEETELVIEISQNHLKLTKNETVLITKLIDGKFPEFKGVLENKPEIVVSVNRMEFISTLNRVAVLTESNDRLRGVKFNLKDGVLQVTVKNTEQEEAVEEMTVVYDGELVESGYNVDYLLDPAQAGESEIIELHLQGSDGICIIKQPDDENTTWLIMPMRI